MNVDDSPWVFFLTVYTSAVASFGFGNVSNPITFSYFFFLLKV